MSENGPSFDQRKLARLKILAAAARADGAIGPREKELLDSFCTTSGISRDALAAVLDRPAATSDDDLPTTTEERKQLLVDVLRICVADRHFDESERQFAGRIASQLGLSDEEIDECRRNASLRKKQCSRLTDQQIDKWHGNADPPEKKANWQAPVFASSLLLVALGVFVCCLGSKGRLSLVFLAVASCWFIYCVWPTPLIRCCATLVRHGDALRGEHPTRANWLYRGAIGLLLRLAARERLEDVVPPLLGQAYLGNHLCLLKQRRYEQAKKQYGAAIRYLKVAPSRLIAMLAETYLETSDLTDDAVSAYLAYLRLPKENAHSDIAGRMLALLEQQARVGDEMDAETIRNKARLNITITALPCGGGTRLVVLSGAGVGKQVTLGKSLTIGREKGNNIIIKDDRVSRHHAKIERSNAFCTLTDVGSRSGTFVAGQRITAPTPLSDGDHIRIGGQTFGFFEKPCVLDHVPAWAHFNLGAARYIQEEYPGACSELEVAAKLQPGHIQTWWYLGRAHRAVDKLDAARSDFATTIKLDETHYGAHAAYSEVLSRIVESGRFEQGSNEWNTTLAEAVKHAEQAALLAPARDDYLGGLARIYSMAGRYYDAMNSASKAIALNDKVASHYIVQAELLRHIGKPEMASNAVHNALAIEPDNLEANTICGSCSFDGGRYGECIERLERVRVREGDQGKPFFSTKPEFGYRLGRSYFELGDNARAYKTLAAVAKQLPEAMLYAGRCLARVGQYDRAVRVFEVLVKRSTGGAEARFYLAASLANCERYVEALHHADALTETADATWLARSHCLSARIMARTGQSQNAIERIDLARAAAPENVDVYFEGGCIACANGDFQKGYDSFEAALRVNPDDVRSHAWCGRSLLWLGRASQAVTHFQKVLEPVSAKQNGWSRSLEGVAHEHLGQIARSEGDNRRALDHFLAARKTGSKSERLCFLLAVSYAECGDDEKALEEFSSLAMKNGDEPGLAFNMAAVSSRMANEHFEQRRYDEAIPLLQQAKDRFASVGASNEVREVTNMLAEATFQQGIRSLEAGNGCVKEAIAALQSALSLRGEDERFRYHLGVGYFRDGQFDEAVSTFRGVAEGDGSDQSTALKALALSLEHAGHPEEAVAVWGKLSERQIPVPCVNIEGKLGLAGFYARREDWRSAAENLNTVLCDNTVRDHPAYQDICKLAISYLSLAGEHKGAENLTREKLRDASPEAVNSYLGALLAQQGQLKEAMTYLEKALRSKSADPAIAQLYDAVCRTIAATQVLAGEKLEAKDFLTKAAKIIKESFSSDSKRLADAIETSMLLAGGVAEVSDAAVECYARALKAQPGNAKLRRNLAILCHRMAIQLEDQDKARLADGYWKRATEQWTAITDRDGGFWQDYRDAYNEGRHRRDQIKESDLPLVQERVREKVSGVHVGFIKGYAAANRVADVKRHRDYYLGFLPKEDRAAELALSALGKTISEEATRLKLAKHDEAFYTLMELAYATAPNDRAIRKGFAVALFNRGTDCANKQDVHGAEQYYRRAEEIDSTIKDQDSVRAMLAQFQILLAVRHLEAGADSKAEAAYRKALDIEPQLEIKPELRKIAGQYYIVKAMKLLARLGGGLAFQRFELIEQIKQSIARAIELDPTLLFTVQGLAGICAQLGIDTGLAGLLGGLMGGGRG